MAKFDKRFYICCMIATFIVIAFSRFELLLSAEFYDKAKGGWFLRETPFVEWIRHEWPTYIYAILAICCGFWLGGKINKQSIFAIKNKTMVYLFLSLIIVPGVIINGLFKGLWGRARPIQVTEFGGSLDYTAPLVYAGQCQNNCSFPSGHATLAFWCLAVALILPKPVRKIAIVAVIIMGIIVSYSRIIGGFHFLSDTIFSFLIVAPSVLWLWRRMGLDKD